MSPDGVEIGKVTKEFSGALRELVTDADNFAVLFPIDLDVRMKATLLGAVFMIVSNLDLDLGLKPFQDFMFFEHKNNDEQSNTIFN